MAFGYTLLLTENPSNEQERLWYGYNVGTGGMLLHMRIEHKLPDGGPDAKAIDDEIFLPSDQVAGMGSIVWTQLADEDIGRGARRVVRAYSTPGGNVIVHRYTKVDFTWAKKTRTIFVDEHVQVISGATISGTDLIYPPGAAPEVPWFVWNATNLSQFDAKVTGPNVASSIADVISYLGLNWIRLSVTSNGVAANGPQQALILPITQAPPTANYRIEADFLSIAKASNFVGAGLLVRYTSLTSYYLTRYNDSSVAGQQRTDKIGAGYSVTELAGRTDEPTVIVGRGVERIGFKVEGQTLLSMDWGERQITRDTSSPYTAAGKAALFCTPSSVISTTATNYFRNVKCYPV